VVDFNGDLIEFFGCNPSGHPLTVIINGLANSLYMRYCYAVLAPDKSATNFKRDVSLMTYGDDNIMGVSPNITFFNHTAIQKVLASVDIEYTMADKGALSKPFIHISESSFLKRSWRYDEDVGAYLCPLDHKSINKMLTVCVSSKTITPQLQAIAVIETALREYFFYGRYIYEFKKIMFEEIVDENNLRLYVMDSTFMSYEDLCNQFWENSKKLKVEALLGIGEQQMQSKDVIVKSVNRIVKCVLLFYLSMLFGFVAQTFFQSRRINFRRDMLRMLVWCLQYRVHLIVSALIQLYIQFVLLFLPGIYDLVYCVIKYMVFRD